MSIFEQMSKQHIAPKCNLPNLCEIQANFILRLLRSDFSKLLQVLSTYLIGEIYLCNLKALKNDENIDFHNFH